MRLPPTRDGVLPTRTGRTAGGRAPSRAVGRRPASTEYRAAVGSLKVVPGNDPSSAHDRALEPQETADRTALGTAFDLMVRFRLDPSYQWTEAHRMVRSNSWVFERLSQLIDDAQRAVAADDRERLARASWALVPVEQVHKSSFLVVSDLEDMLAPDVSAAPRDAIRQLAELDRLAATALLPHLKGSLYCGPTFEGSVHCPAEADVIAGDLLIDIKVKVGRASAKTGARPDNLKLWHLHQVICYALFDRSDSFKIRRVGIYSARYGHLATWDLQDLLDRLAGGRVDLPVLREDVWRAIGGR